MKFRYLILLISLIFSQSISAQILDHKLGELLVKVDSPKKIQSLVHKYSRFQRSSTNITVEKSLVSPMNIYLLKFDFTRIDENRLLQTIQNDKNVEIAQFNHLISYRNTPNDPLFTSQWQYIGINGGTDGVDIDADLAWDVTTGGITVHGDTIVVCIIDGGIDLNHEDLSDNLWVNRFEIPNDGIDNDGNGYIDDVRGWDTADNSDDVNNGTHGTKVAGIVGAVGNNEIGVAGVNWDVKMMIVRGGGDEANALSAYAYPYVMRKMYNETNGAKGAFVVATNASWGVDKGKAEDAPLWCSFYDSLGMVGILNCGATVNQNFDVDVVGDLPTQCTSDYLIAVTNMNKSDNKVLDAGYGTTSIDIGAFGEGTFTVAPNNKYGTFGGTSGATPHVAGAIALLYAAPCVDFMDLVKAHPDSAALAMRSFILDGVDHNTSLEGITTTEGRLNVNNSMQLLLNVCRDCVYPYGLAANLTSPNSIEMSWITSGDDIANVDLEWRKQGDADWHFEKSVTSPFTLTDVQSCSVYEYRLRSVCADTTSDYSNSKFINTEMAPVNLNISDIQAYELEVSWELPSIISSDYQLELYDQDELVERISSIATSSMYRFKGLKSCTDYEVILRSSCDAMPSILKDKLIRTKGCGYCLDTDYCEPKCNSSEEWINNLKVGDKYAPTGNNNGYFFNTNVSFDFKRGETVPITLYPKFSGAEYSDKVAVWLDVNRDGLFDDSDSVFHEVYTKDEGEVLLNIEVPMDMESGSTRMRVIFSFNVSEKGCDDFDYGEVEDYCVNIQDCFFDVNSLGIETTKVSASLSWNNPDKLTTTLRYRKLGTGEWNVKTVTEHIVNLDNLEKCTNYELQFSVNCQEGATDFSSSINFKTKCESSTQDLVDISELIIHPNPVSDVLNIDFKSSISSKYDWHIYNLQGKEIQSKENVKLLQGKNEIHIPIEHTLVSGIYFLQFNNDTFSKTMKFIKL